MEDDMNASLAYPGAGPRRYRPRVSTYWWLWRWAYLKFILRELSSLFVAYFVVLLLLLLHAVRQGPEAYQAFQAWVQAPHLVALNAISLCFVLVHAITWFNLAPRAIVVRLRGQRLPDWLIAGGNYAAWAAVSAVVAWLVLRG
jgi:fumarate reductase subunit C